MKKIFAMLLCTVMLFSSFSVFAAEAATDETDPYAFDEEYYSRFEGQDITLYVYNWANISPTDRKALRMSFRFLRI